MILARFKTWSIFSKTNRVLCDHVQSPEELMVIHNSSFFSYSFDHCFRTILEYLELVTKMLQLQP